MRRAARLVLTLAGAGLAACSSLPEYAAPKGGLVDPARLDTSDVIAYRTLSRADFRGQEPPAVVAPYADRIGAATCAHILTTPDTQVLIHPASSRDGKPRYRAEPHRLRFIARMDRSCSWWNPSDVGMPEAYILEHEQIHFALFELEARRLNAALPEIERRLRVTAASADEAAGLAQRELKAELQGRVKGILARSRAFDEDTSMGHKPQQQKRWWERVQAELAATGG